MADVAERTDLYHADEHAWIAKQVEALRSGDYGSLDRDDLVEFLTSMALRDERELESRLIVLLAHVIKIYEQPHRITRSWRATITVQQIEIGRILKKLPSLYARADAVLESVKPDALRLARVETGMKFDSSIPLAWTLATLLDFDASDVEAPRK